MITRIARCILLYITTRIAKHIVNLDTIYTFWILILSVFWINKYVYEKHLMNPMNLAIDRWIYIILYT